MNARGDRRGLVVGLALVLTTAVVSGVSTFVNIYAVAGTNSDAFVTVRNLAVAAMLLPIALAAAVIRPSSTPLRRTDWARLVAIGLIGGAVPFLLFFRGVELATAEGGATTASFFYRTLFLFATVFAWFFLKERFRWPVVFGAILLLGGCYLLLSLTSVVLTDGTLYVLAATVLWAGEYTLSKRTLRDLPSSTVGLGRMGFGAMFLAAYLAFTAQWGAVGHFSGAQWSWVAISAVLLTAFVATWYAGLARVDLSVGAAVLVLGYPVTWLLSVGMRGEAVVWTPALGTLAITAGVLAMIVASWRSGVARPSGWGRPDAPSPPA
ncbi:MAG TPA: DMT family transporter [Thermoplasmata archaeon]|nr:DMT family transporter [Thermoplasmata archaeon]